MEVEKLPIKKKPGRFSYTLLDYLMVWMRGGDFILPAFLMFLPLHILLIGFCLVWFSISLYKKKV
jgi:hypothetical protein